MQNGISLVVAILACAQGAHAQVGVDTKSVVQHQWYAAAIITLAWLIMTIIIAFMQGVTRLMAGGNAPTLLACMPAGFGWFPAYPWDLGRSVNGGVRALH